MQSNQFSFLPFILRHALDVNIWIFNSAHDRTSIGKRNQGDEKYQVVGTRDCCCIMPADNISSFNSRSENWSCFPIASNMEIRRGIWRRFKSLKQSFVLLLLFLKSFPVVCCCLLKVLTRKNLSASFYIFYNVSKTRATRKLFLLNSGSWFFSSSFPSARFAFIFLRIEHFMAATHVQLFTVESIVRKLKFWASFIINPSFSQSWLKHLKGW